MPRYGGIDLPSTNRLVAWLDERDHVVADKRLSNDLHTVPGSGSGHLWESPLLCDEASVLRGEPPDAPSGDLPLVG